MGIDGKRRMGAAAAGLAVTGGIVAFNEVVVRIGPPPALRVVVVSTLAVAVLAVLGAEWPASRRWLGAAACLVASLSILLSLLHFSGDTPREAMWLIAEMGVILVLLIMVVRWEPARRAGLIGCLVAAAQVLMVLRVSSATDALLWSGATTMWASGAAAAGGLGLYLRLLDRQRLKSVVAARRAQRLELARDLHDFVAHDVTGMVVQAQAAQVVAEQDPGAALAALRRVEEAGLHALGSLDRTVRMLGELAEPAEAAAPAGLDEIEDLVRRFSAGDATPVQLAIDPALPRDLPPDVGSTAHRVVLEALTNVRRHASAAATIAVEIAGREGPRGPALIVTVRDEARAGGVPARRALDASGSNGNGSGLVALRERVESVGGTFEAGPLGRWGWSVTATLPLAGGARRA
jgi:signal transduction histidine kinase